MERRTYTDEFKRYALAMLHGTDKVGAEVAKEFGIGAGQLNRWRCTEERKHKEGLKVEPVTIFV